MRRLLFTFFLSTFLSLFSYASNDNDATEKIGTGVIVALIGLAIVGISSWLRNKKKSQ